MGQRSPSRSPHVVLARSQDLGGVRGELGAASAVARPIRRLQIDEVGHHRQGLVERSTVQGTQRLRFPIEHRVPGIGLGELGEPDVPMRHEQLGEVGIIGASAALAGGVECRFGRGPACDRLHVMAQVRRRASPAGICRPSRRGEAVPVPPLVGEANDSRTSGPRSSRWISMSATSQPVAKLLIAQSCAPAWSDRPISRAPPAPAGGRNATIGPQDIGLIARIDHERLAEDPDVVPEHRGRDLVRVAGASDVAKQRDPVGGPADLVVESRLLSRPRRRGGTTGVATPAAGRTQSPGRGRTSQRVRRVAEGDARWKSSRSVRLATVQRIHPGRGSIPPTTVLEPWQLSPCSDVPVSRA